jgi:hypothetical protein
MTDTLTTRRVETPNPAPLAAAGPLRILGRANSFNVRKVLWVCDEIGIPDSREDFGHGCDPRGQPSTGIAVFVCGASAVVLLRPDLPLVIRGEQTRQPI